MSSLSSSLLQPLLAPWVHRVLIFQFVRRDVVGRYRGSLLGIGWSFLTPLLMLGVYTFVFVGVFKARWPGAEEGGGAFFAARVFCGLIVFNFVAEVLNRSPTLITEQPNLVKKVVFPLETLVAVVAGSALFHLLIGVTVLLGVVLVVHGQVPLTVIATPLVLLPLVPLMMGIGWILAALGVFVRDIGQVMTMVTSLLMFLSPVFYSLHTVPEEVRGLMMVLPTTLAIENLRLLFFAGQWPEWSALAVQWGVSGLAALVGAAFFQNVRRGFADVL